MPAASNWPTRPTRGSCAQLLLAGLNPQARIPPERAYLQMGDTNPPEHRDDRTMGPKNEHASTGNVTFGLVGRVLGVVAPLGPGLTPTWGGIGAYANGTETSADGRRCSRRWDGWPDRRLLSCQGGP